MELNLGLCIAGDSDVLPLNIHEWIKSGRDKISARGSQIVPNVQHTDEKLKDQKETNRQTDRIRQYKKKQ
jgi:hypothetical protein